VKEFTTDNTDRSHCDIACLTRFPEADHWPEDHARGGAIRSRSRPWHL